MTSSDLNEQGRRTFLRWYFWQRPWWAALLAMLLVFATEQVVDHYARQSELEQEKVVVLDSLSTIRARLEGTVNANLLLVHGLTAVISAQPDIDQAGFARIAQGLVDDRHALRNIAGAPGMVVSLMYPLAGNETAIGLDYRTHPIQSAAALKVMETGKPLVAGPLPLVQGGVGIIAREPVYLPAAQPGGKPRFWGLVSAVIDVDTLYRLAELDKANLDAGKLRLAIRGTNGTGEQGPVFYGDASVFSSQPVTSTINLPGGTWQVAALPVAGWGQASQALMLIRLFGLLAALAAGTLTYFLTRGRQALAGNEARLRALLNTLPDLVWLKDPNGVYLACNPRFETLYDARETDIVGKTDHDFVAAELAEFFREKDRAAIAAGGPSVNEEWLSFARDGHRELAETIKTPVFDGRGRLLGVLGIARNITERKQAAQRIENLNRIYAVLSGINETIVRQREPDRLFHEACRIAVEVGGFRMAWVGMADQVSGEVKPVASAGHVDGYLERLHVSLGDDERGRGPSGLALKQGQHVVCDDIASDPRLAPWREDALALGYRSSVSLPIKCGEQVRGVYTLYADQTDFFDQAELRLLDELALDIGFALDFIETETARDTLSRHMVDLLDSMGDGFVSLDRDWRYRYVNRKAGEMLGQAAGELVGKQIWSAFPDAPSDPLRLACEQTMAEGVTSCLEEFYPPLGKWFEHSIYPTQDGISIFLSDITERKRAEDELRREKNILDRTSRLAQVGGWGFDAATLRGTWTAETARIHDLEPSLEVDAAYGMSFYQGESRQLIELAVRNAIDSGQPYDLELELTSAKGVKKWVRTIGLPVLEGGKVVRLEGAIQDVTGRKLAEAKARQGEIVLDSVFQALPDLFFLLDPDGTIRDYRAQKSADLYVPPEMFINKRMQEVVPAPVAAQFEQNIAAVRQHGGLATYEYELELPHGARNFEARLSQLPDSGQLIAVVRDITARKQMEDEIRQLNADLEERVLQRTAELASVNKELETFTYSVSHDLKAPLRGIDGYSRMLLEDHLGQLDEEGRLFLGNVRHGVDQMNQLIEDLLAYSRMERRSLSGMDLNLDRQLSALLAEREDELRAKGIEIRLDLAVHTVRADPDGFNMVLRNLLDNAIKFSRDSKPPIIEIQSTAKPESTILSIKDNGIGFDMQFQDRIFEIFQRLQRSEDFQGTGVGLAIVRKAMQRMGGRVWAESAPGQGATFHLELPR